MNSATATTATLARGWHLVRLDNTTTAVTCDHCPAGVKRGFVIRDAEGTEIRVGRNCVKALTGWNLTDALAARLLRCALRASLLTARAATIRAEFPTLSPTQVSDVASLDHNWVGDGWRRHAANFAR